MGTEFDCVIVVEFVSLGVVDANFGGVVQSLWECCGNGLCRTICCGV